MKTHFLPSCGFSMITDSYKKSTRRVKLSATITGRYYVLLRFELEKTQLVLCWFQYTVRASATDALCWAEAEKRKSTQFLSMPVEAFDKACSHKACSTFFLYDPVLHFIGL